jgi:hypothetical protein
MSGALTRIDEEAVQETSNAIPSRKSDISVNQNDTAEIIESTYTGNTREVPHSSGNACMTDTDEWMDMEDEMDLPGISAEKAVPDNHVILHTENAPDHPTNNAQENLPQDHETISEPVEELINASENPLRDNEGDPQYESAEEPAGGEDERIGFPDD